MGLRGPKKIKVDWGLVERCAQIDCTQEEIAAVIGCSLDTVERRCEEDNGIKFAEYYKEKKLGGRASLRRQGYKHAEKSAAVWIFLAKNRLGMRDNPEPTETNNKGLIVDALDEAAEDKDV